MPIVGYIILGLLTGALSGLVGSGGGIVVVPALVYLFGLSMHMAQGTTLAMFLPPVGILAAWSYYKKGFVDIRAAFLMATGFMIGGFFGAKLAINLPEVALRRIFALVMGLISIKMFFQKSKEKK